MRALVTGGAGFIGSHLAQRLLQDGNSVEVVDNLSTGSLENIDGFRSSRRFGFVEGDIRDGELMDSLARRCDVVFHLAAAVGVRLIVDDPVHTIETNIGGTEAVLEAANRYGRKVLLASSSEVYGKSESAPFREDDNIVLGSTTMPRWSYACSKAIDEFLGLAFYRQYGLGVVIARFFNTIGPRQTGQYGMVVPRFIGRALNNEPVEIYGSGRQSRCFCYVGDVVDAVIGLMSCEKAAGRVFNIGSDEEIGIEQLADKIVQMTNSKSTKKFLSYQVAYGRPIEDMMRRVPDVQRVKDTIGWRAETSLNETLGIIIESFK